MAFRLLKDKLDMPTSRLQEELCGTLSYGELKDSSNSIESLDKPGAIFSCGGVYLSPSAPSSKQETQFLFLPNHQKSVLVFKNFNFQCRMEQAELHQIQDRTDSEIPLDLILRRSFQKRLS